MIIWLSPQGYRFRQVKNKNKLILFNANEMKTFDSARHALDSGWQKIDLASLNQGQ